MNKQQTLLEQMNNRRGWILGVIGLIAVIVTLIELFVDNCRLAAIVTIVVCFIALWLLCIYVRRASRISDLSVRAVDANSEESALWQDSLSELRETLARRFNASELRTLCFDMGINYDDLPGPGNADKARELVSYLERRNRIPELEKTGKRLRPDISWDDIFKPLLERLPPDVGGRTNIHCYSEGQRVLALVGIVLIPICIVIVIFIGRAICGTPKVAFQTTHGRYVSAMGNDEEWLIIAQAFSIDDYERFTLLCLDDGRVAFQTWHTKDGKNRVVSAMGEDKDWILMAETNVIDAYEKFTFFDADTGIQRSCLEVVESLEADGKVRIALYTYHGRFVTAMDGNWDPPWLLRAETHELGESEKFLMILLPDDD